MDDLQVAWGWEVHQVVYLYTQLYVMPLMLMLILSAMTLFRREMSCNRIYALEDGRTRQSQAGASSVVSPYLASMFAPLIWFRFDRGTIDPEEDNNSELPTSEEKSSEEETTTGAARDQQQDDRDPLKAALSDLMKMQWSEDTQYAVDAVMERLPHGVIRRLSEASLRMIPRRQRKTDVSCPLHPENFPADVQVNIMSFLQPKDVVTVACAGKSCKEIVDGDGPTTVAVWKTLWQRDYGWLIHSWEIGKKAFLRSNASALEAYGKEFYFQFGLSYVNYVLAGLNTPDHCLVGLHGNIYDITDFVIRHPGSPETLFVHAGRDASKLFDDMDHSKVARRLAKEFCVAVDMSYNYGSCGLRPTIAFEADGAIPAVVEAKPVIGKKDRKLRQPQCLKKILDQFYSERRQKRKELSLEMKEDTNVLHWTLYYDPYQRAWKAWYTNRDFENVFV